MHKLADVTRHKKKNLGGRPSLFPGARARTLNLTDAAVAKAKADAAAMGENVSMSQATEAAIRAFDAREFKP